MRYHSMEDITVTTPGTEKILKGFNPAKAASSDIAESPEGACPELAPLLTIIFQSEVF